MNRKKLSTEGGEFSHKRLELICDHGVKASTHQLGNLALHSQRDGQEAKGLDPVVLGATHQVAIDAGKARECFGTETVLSKKFDCPVGNAMEEENTGDTKQ
jgi:hypothetical protein